MKFGIIDFSEFKQNLKDDAAITNLGDNCVTKSIEYLYDYIGIKKNKIVYIKFDELWTYKGDYIIVPINTIIFQIRPGQAIHNISSRIIPVFLGFSYNSTKLDLDDVLYLKKYEPIGCRDQQTLCTLRNHNIDAYLYGCLVATLPKRWKEQKYNKVFFVDVPKEIKEYIPEKIKKDIVFIKQEIKTKELIPLKITAREWAEELLKRYYSEPRLIVTSRFHAAILGIALGIPTIIINEEFTYRFSWLNKLLPFYTRNNYSFINWDCQALDFENNKKQMLNLAKKRILDCYKKYNAIFTQSSFMENDNLPEARFIDYYLGAIEFIKKNWTPDEKISYGFWGCNINSDAIYDFIQKNYKNAQLTTVLDTYKEFEYHGIKSIKPEDYTNNDRSFIFVTTFVAGYVAKEVFRLLNIPESQYYLCDREYITNEDL